MQEKPKQTDRHLIGSPRRVLRDIHRAFHDAEFKGLLFFATLLILTGTIFYMVIENWDFLEAMYFSVATLTTVGYGDLHPTSDLSRLFTAIYALLGVGFILSFVMVVARLANGPVMKRLSGDSEKPHQEQKKE